MVYTVSLVIGKSLTGRKSFVITVVPVGYRRPDGGRVLADSRLVYGGGLAVSPRPVRHAQPTREYDEQLEHDEHDQHQCERVRIPVKGVLVARGGVGGSIAAAAGEVDLVAGFAPLGFELELVLDADLLEDHFVGLVAVGATSAAPSVERKWFEFKRHVKKNDCSKPF